MKNWGDLIGIRHSNGGMGPILQDDLQDFFHKNNKILVQLNWYASYLTKAPVTTREKVMELIHHKKRYHIDGIYIFQILLLKFVHSFRAVLEFFGLAFFVTGYADSCWLSMSYMQYYVTCFVLYAIWYCFELFFFHLCKCIDGNSFRK